MSNARNLSQGDTRFVNTSGDTMTGDLSVTGGNFTVGSTNANPFNWSGSTNPVSISADASNTWAQLSLQGNGTGGTGINLGSSGLRHAGIFSLDGSSLAFATNNTNSGISTREHMRIDSAGRVTMPYQPAFMVTQAGSTNNQTGVVVDFSVVIENRGSHFSLTTNRFTAPVTGMYHFHVHTFVDAGNGASSEIYLRKNGSIYGFGCEIRNYTSDISASYGPPMTIQATVGCNANDYVDVFTNIGLHANYGTFFGGYLIG